MLSTGRYTMPKSIYTGTNPNLHWSYSDYRIVRAIRAYHEAHGYPPTIEEIAAMTNMALQETRSRIDRLRLCKRVWYHDARPRSLIVIED